MRVLRLSVAAFLLAFAGEGLAAESDPIRVDWERRFERGRRVHNVGMVLSAGMPVALATIGAWQIACVLDCPGFVGDQLFLGVTAVSGAVGIAGPLLAGYGAWDAGRSVEQLGFGGGSGYALLGLSVWMAPAAVLLVRTRNTALKSVVLTSLVPLAWVSSVWLADLGMTRARAGARMAQNWRRIGLVPVVGPEQQGLALVGRF